MNRLAAETSPYLLQHKDDPIDWYPWGPEAFDRARELNAPVLLSIGYSTCHWCHTMARESFSDPAIGTLIDAGFVAVKVDREERPELDAVYGEAAREMSGVARVYLHAWQVTGDARYRQLVHETIGDVPAPAHRAS